MADTMHKFHLRKLTNGKGETVRNKTEAEDMTKKEEGTTINPQIDISYLWKEEGPKDPYDPNEEGNNCPVRNPTGARF